jgi:flagellar assembly protein FliH
MTSSSESPFGRANAASAFERRDAATALAAHRASDRRVQADNFDSPDAIAAGAARLAQRIAQRDAELQAQRTGAAARAPMATAAPTGAAPAPPSSNPYARFIPREELGAFAAWQPDAFAGGRERPNVSAVPDPEQQRQAAERAAAEAVAHHERERERRLSARAHELHKAREDGYTEGQRDAQAAFETFRQGFAAQAGGHIDGVLAALQARLLTLEQDLAQRVAGIALELAQQVVRGELRLNPAQVVAVTQEALGALLVSARHVTVRLNPEDFTLVAEGCAEIIAVRGARLVSDRGIERGGCLVDSDIGLVDASVASRWHRAAAAIGRTMPWSPGEPRVMPAPEPVFVPDPAPQAAETANGTMA